MLSHKNQKRNDLLTFFFFSIRSKGWHEGRGDLWLFCYLFSSRFSVSFRFASFFFGNNNKLERQQVCVFLFFHLPKKVALTTDIFITRHVKVVTGGGLWVTQRGLLSHGSKQKTRDHKLILILLTTTNVFDFSISISRRWWRRNPTPLIYDGGVYGCKILAR